jgi:hypothetical protein
VWITVDEKFIKNEGVNRNKIIRMWQLNWNEIKCRWQEGWAEEQVSRAAVSAMKRVVSTSPSDTGWESGLGI